MISIYMVFFTSHNHALFGHFWGASKVRDFAEEKIV